MRLGTLIVQCCTTMRLRTVNTSVLDVHSNPQHIQSDRYVHLIFIVIHDSSKEREYGRNP